MPGTAYSEITHDIRVTVRPEFFEEESEPEQAIYAFAYTVTLENLGTHTVQLLRRHWNVMSAGEPYTEVKGDGVVGEQPVLEPGEIYQYMSGCVIKDPFGSMHGTYTFQDSSENFFDVIIPKFDLVCPHLVH